MPLYEYRCKACGHVFEKIQSFSAPDQKECPQCQGEVERLLSAPAIQFKGAGWYVNDYAAKGKDVASKAGSASSDSSSSASESAPSSKSEGTKSESAPAAGTPVSSASSAPGSSSSSSSGSAS